jgi:hypothetical protein
MDKMNAQVVHLVHAELYRQCYAKEFDIARHDWRPKVLEISNCNTRSALTLFVRKRSNPSRYLLATSNGLSASVGEW